MDERITKATAGDREVLAELLFEHHGQLCQFISRKIPAKLRASVSEEDIVQQTFVNSFRGIREFRPKSGHSFARWLKTLAENCLVDAIRREGAQKRGALRDVLGQTDHDASSLPNPLDRAIDSLASPSQIISRKEAIQLLQVHLAGLSDEYRQVIQLREIEGLSREEVAERMGRSTVEIRGLLYRARKKLRDAMGQSALYLTKK